MSGETEKNVSGWTTDTLHTHMDTQLRDLRSALDERHAAQQLALLTALTTAEKAVDRAMQAAEKAVNKAEIAADKRFELLNELRDGVATKEQVEAVDKQIDDLKSRMDRTEGRGVGLNAGWVYLVGGVATLSVLLTIYLALNP